MKSLFLAGALAAMVTGSAFAGSTFATVAASSGCSSLPCDESTTSLGQFIIRIDPSVQAIFAGAGIPGYDSGTGLLTSPLLYDQNTVIGLSTSYTDGSRPGSLQVGTTGSVSGVGVTAVTETGGNAPTALPPGYSTTTGQDAISTAVLNVALSNGGGMSVGMGASYGTTGLALGSANLGEVEALGCSTGGAGCSDFPAQSFFDVFADVSMLGMTFSNTDPLVVSSTIPSPGALPPTVVYIHGQSTAVQIFADANEGPFTAHELIGTFVLTGHGVSYTNSAADQDSFANTFEQDVANDAYDPTTNPNGLTPTEQAVVDSNISEFDTPEPSSWLLFSGAAFGLFGLRKKLVRSN